MLLSPGLALVLKHLPAMCKPRAPFRKHVHSRRKTTTSIQFRNSDDEGDDEDEYDDDKTNNFTALEVCIFFPQVLLENFQEMAPIV